MGLETATYISGLNASNPIHATDDVGQGDDHIRLIKSTLKSTWPNVNGAVNYTPAEANHLVGVTSSIQTQLDGKAASSHTHAASDIVSGTFADARIAESNVTQWEASLTITQGQISSLDGYQFATLEIGHATDSTLSRGAAGKLEVEGKPILAHNDGALGSGEIYVSTLAPSGGSDGDIWLEREA